MNWFKKSVVICLAAALLICSHAFSYTVKADNVIMPYIALPYSFLVGSTSYGKEPYKVVDGNNVVDNNLDVRCIMFYEGTESSPSWKQMRCMTNTSGIGVHQWNGGNGDWTLLNSTYVKDGVTYYWKTTSRSVNEWYAQMLNVGGLVDGNCTDAQKLERLYDYTYGDNSSTPIDVGALMNVSLSTRYVNEQKSYSSQNLDVISWYGYQDVNYNDITGLEWFVDIRARKISYSGNSPTDLLSRTQNEAVFTDNYFDIVSVSAKKGDYSLTWGDVYNLMDISAYQILPSESLFYTYGWVYEIRLRNADTNDSSDWQTIYTLSSLPPQTTQDFGNNVGFNQTATEIIYQVDTQNMNSNTNYNVTNNYYNDIPVGSDDYTQDVNGKPWYVILLEGILGLLQSIVDAVAGVASDVINGLFNFVTTLGVNLVDFFSNLFDNLRTGFSDIDLDLPMWEIDFDFEDPANQTIINLPAYIISKMFNSGLGYMILIPLVLFLVRMFF